MYIPEPNKHICSYIEKLRERVKEMDERISSLHKELFTLFKEDIFKNKNVLILKEPSDIQYIKRLFRVNYENIDIIRLILHECSYEIEIQFVDTYTLSIPEVIVRRITNFEPEDEFFQFLINLI